MSRHVTDRRVHPIESESYRRLRAVLDTRELPPLTRAVVERVVHATADVDFAADVVADEAALVAGRDALAAGAVIVVDARMVAVGISGAVVRCGLDEPDVAEEAAAEHLTRSAAGIRHALRAVGAGALVVVGTAPTALFEVVRAAADEALTPALVVGFPVGFVDAVESKEALRASGLPAVSNRGPKGGAGVAAAAVNALRYTDLHTVVDHPDPMSDEERP